MSPIEGWFFWLALIGYGLAGILNLASLTVFKNKRLLLLSRQIGLVAFFSHLISLAVRTIITGHFPVKGGYENTIAGVAFVMFFYYLLLLRFPSLELVGSGVFFLSLLVMGYGLTDIPPHGPLTPPYKSIWLWIHVLFAWLAYSAYTIAAALALLYLLRERGKVSGKLAVKLPDKEEIDSLWFGFVVFGFISNAVMISSGSIWAHYLWGSYWKWDPVETWSLISWLTFGLFLHLRLTLGWRGKKLAWVTLLGLLTINISFWGIQLVPQSYHLFRKL